MIRRFHDSLFAGHLGVSRTIYRLRDRVYWPGLHNDVRSYIASCTVCLARKSPCRRRAPMGHVDVGYRWDRVAMDLLASYNPKGKSLCSGDGGLFFLDGRRLAHCPIRQQDPDLPDPIMSPYVVWVRWKWRMTRSVDIRGRQCSNKNGSTIGELFDGCCR